MDLGGFDGSRTWAQESDGQGSSASSHGAGRWPGVFVGAGGVQPLPGWL